MGRQKRPKPLSPFEHDVEYEVLDAADDNLTDRLNELAKQGFKVKTTLSNGKKILMEKSIPKAISRRDSALRHTAAEALSGQVPGSVDAKAMDAAIDRAEKIHGIASDTKK